MKFQLTPFHAIWAKPFTSVCTAILTTLSQSSYYSRRCGDDLGKSATLQDEVDLFVWCHNSGIRGLRCPPPLG